MPEELNRDERVALLMRHPLSLNSMNRAGMGAVGTWCDISIEPGWVAIIERLYVRFESLPEIEGHSHQSDQGKIWRAMRVSCRLQRRRRRDHRAGRGRSGTDLPGLCCRGRRRDFWGWIFNLCVAHWDPALGLRTREVGKNPGVDEPVANWALAVAPSFSDDGALGCRALRSMDRGSGWGQASAYFAGVIETDAMVISLEAARIQNMLGPMPFTVMSADAVFDSLASQKGADRQELARRITKHVTPVSRTGEPGQAARLAAIWRWLSGLDEPPER